MIKSIIKDHLEEVVKTVVAQLIDEIQNGEGGGSIDLEQLLEILMTLLTGCLDTDSMEKYKIDTLLRRR